MKKELTYNDTFNKAHVIEVYAKAIANLGPLNVFTEKNISFHSRGDDNSRGLAGFCLIGLLGPLYAYIGSHLLQCKESASQCEMERSIPLTEKCLRKITMKNLEGKLNVTIEGSPRYVRKTERLMNELFTVDPAEYAQAQRIVDFLKE
jgi:hypothetical protein